MKFTRDQKIDLVLIIISAMSITSSFILSTDHIAWIAVILCGVPIFKECAEGLITEFDIKRIVDDYGKDISEWYSEKTELLTENMLDEFVFKYRDVLADELNSIRCGGSKLEVMDYRWENKQG